MSQTAAQPIPRLRASVVLITMTALFGVALPLFTLIFEFATRMCTESYINPIPTPLYALLIALVPAAGVAAIKSLRAGAAAPKPTTLGLIGAALGGSVFYSIVFGPIALFAIMAIMFAGLGFLPLSPILSGLCILIMTIIFIRRDKRSAGPIFLGFAFISALILCLQANTVFTRQCMADAVRGKTPAEKHAAVRLLRAMGNRDVMLRDCYSGWFRNSVDDVASAFMFNSSTSFINDNEARMLFYKVTGQPFNSFPRPQWSGNSWSSRFDADTGGTEVGGLSEGLSLASSTMTGKADFNESVGALDWTATFKNTSYGQQEARMEIAMPPDAVIDGAWLWVNGEARPAVFGEKSKVRAAYEAVVRKRRDPLLVTMAGNDRILVQCFPVPPRSGDQPGTMKIKISMSVPLQYNKDGREWMALPRIAEKNFEVAAKHDVSLQIANAKNLGASTKSLYPADIGMKGSIPNEEMDNFQGIIAGTPLSTDKAMFAPLTQAKGFVVRRIGQRNPLSAKHLYIVIDGGSGMVGQLQTIANQLKTLPSDRDVKVIFASDEVSSLTTGGKEVAPLNEALKELGTAPLLGGPDNLPAIELAQKLAKKDGDAAILWIHGPQPLKPEQTLSTTKQQDKPTPFVDFEVSNGPNKIAPRLKESPDLNVLRVARTGPLLIDLQDCLARFSSSDVALPAVHFETTTTAPDMNTSRTENAAIYESLGTAEQVEQLLAQGKDTDAALMAAKAHIITPVTGAVVLETDKDYKDAGLDPKDASKNVSFNLGGAPTVPEADTPLLLLVTLLLFGGIFLQRRKSATSR